MNGEKNMAYIEAKSRIDYRLKCIEQEISQNNRIRIIDAFIDSYDKEFGREKDKKLVEMHLIQNH